MSKLLEFIFALGFSASLAADCAAFYMSDLLCYLKDFTKRLKK